jgi:hypothetical protein
MVAFRRPDDMRFEDLPLRDQFRVKIGKTIAKAMKAAMDLAEKGGYRSLSNDAKAEVLTSITVMFVSEIEDVIRECAEQKRDEEGGAE